MISFGKALKNGELKTSMSQLNLSEQIMSAVNQSNLEEFVKAMENNAECKKNKNDDDDQMDTK